MTAADPPNTATAPPPTRAGGRWRTYAGPASAWASAVVAVAGVGYAGILVRHWAAATAEPIRKTPPPSELSTVWDAVAAVAAAVLAGAFGGGRSPRRWRGVAAVAAGLLVWFNPALIVAGHARNISVAPAVAAVLTSVLLARVGWAFAAGVVLGLGVRAEPLAVVVAPILILWPAAQGRAAAAGRVAAGGVAAVAVAAAPALAGDGGAVTWVAVVAVAAAALPWAWHRLGVVTGLPRWTAAAVVAASGGVVVAGPFFMPQNRGVAAVGLAAAAAVVAVGTVVKPTVRAVTPFAAGVAGVALLVCPLLLHGSYRWWAWDAPPAVPIDNLPAVLARHFSWPLDRPTARLAPYLPAGVADWVAPDRTIGGADAIVIGLAAVACGVAAGVHARRDDRRLLVAVAAPLVAYVAVGPWAGERALLLAAGVAVVAGGSGVGAALLAAFLSVVAAGTSLRGMWAAADPAARFAVSRHLARGLPWLFADAPGSLPVDVPPRLGSDLRAGGLVVGGVLDDDGPVAKWARVYDGSHPDLGWAVLVAAAVLLYVAVVPRRTVPRVGEFDL